jgi:tetratricopeptide (TPR) repeat protein
VIVAAVSATGFRLARWRVTTDRASLAERAYQARQWSDAAKLARNTLAGRKDDAEALRVLARASARLGRDDIATSIYQRRFDENSLKSEDQLLLGLIHQRHGRADAAAAAWRQALQDGDASPFLLEELARYCVQGRHFDEAIQATERLSRQPGWEARGVIMLGTIRLELSNVPEAAKLFVRAMDLDPAVIDASHDPIPLRKVIARTFLRMGRGDNARPLLLPILVKETDPEAAWLLSRAHLQMGEKTLAIRALEKAADYRSGNPLEPEPAPFVGEASCEKCHATIFRRSLANRHTRTYYRGAQLDALSLPDGPLSDPDDPEVTHSFRRHEGVMREETRVGDQLFSAVVEYAFGTAERYLTMVTRDSKGGYHISRLSYDRTREPGCWTRSVLDMTHPTRTRPADFQGEPLAVRSGMVKCLYCHVTNPRTGNDAIGPEMADRAIGCERCHGPGGNHLTALETEFPDLAIVNPATASPHAVTAKQCNDCHVLEHRIREQDPENPGWVRSQGIGWARSRCNTESGGAFGCVTCHDPHQTAAATSTADYEIKCLKCHSAAKPSEPDGTPSRISQVGAPPTSRACPVNETSGCISCHMPSVAVDALRAPLTDHHIRVRRSKP